MSNVLNQLAGTVNVAGMVSGIFYWMGIFFLSLLLIGVIVFMLYMLSFNMPATIFQLSAIGNEKFGVTRIKKNRIKFNKSKTAWKTMYPLFNNTMHEPFESKYILPGKNVVAFEVNGILQPVELNIDENGVMAKPIKYNIKDWLSLQFKKNAEEFAKKDFWTENRQFFMVIGTVLFCCILAGVVIYFTFQFAGPRAEEIAGLSRAIESLGRIAGRPAG